MELVIKGSEYGTNMIRAGRRGPDFSEAGRKHNSKIYAPAPAYFTTVSRLLVHPPGWYDAAK